MLDASHYHPMTVHFPVALILAGFVADSIAMFFCKKESSLSKTGFYLMILGTIGAAAAWFTGEYFTEKYTGEAGELREEHELFSKITLYVMIAASLIRIYAVLARKQQKWLRWFIYLLFAAGTAAVAYCGFLGGTLVYEYLMIT